MVDFWKSQQTKRAGGRSFDVLEATKNSENLYCELSALVRGKENTYHHKETNRQMTRTFQKV
jgi:hypothetical protein